MSTNEKIMKLTDEGLSAREIAKKLGIKQNTVYTVRHIMRKKEEQQSKKPKKTEKQSVKVKDEPTPTKDEREDYEMKRLKTELDSLKKDYEKLESKCKELEEENHSLELKNRYESHMKDDINSLTEENKALMKDIVAIKDSYETQKSLHHILLDYVVHLNKLNKNS